jgi:predicted esterase
MRKLCALFLFPALAFSAATNSPPVKVIQLSVPANNGAFIEAQRAGVANLTALKAVLALPEGFDPKKPSPILLVTASSGSSAVQMWPAYTNVALREGWIVVAVDGPKVSEGTDKSNFSRAMISALFEHLRRSWPQSKTWPVACAGFSGGGKRAAMTAADLMVARDNVIGVFMGGCNKERTTNTDRASDGYHVSKPGVAFLDLPFFLSNGLNDPIAGPQRALEVKQLMEQTGFRKIRLEIYPGQHQLDTNHLRLALQWFRPPPGKAR